MSRGLGDVYKRQNLDKKMNPELYSEQEQQQEQQKNQKRDRGMHL
ncbi:hypothetical protein JMUB7529_28090 [Staphylococcus aureus]